LIGKGGSSIRKWASGKEKRRGLEKKDGTYIEAASCWWELFPGKGLISYVMKGGKDYFEKTEVWSKIPRAKLPSPSQAPESGGKVTVRQRKSKLSPVKKNVFVTGWNQRRLLLPTV